MRHLGTILILAVLAWTGNEVVSSYSENTSYNFEETKLEEITLNIDNQQYLNELESAVYVDEELNTSDEVETSNFAEMNVTLEEIELDLVNYRYQEELYNAKHPLLERKTLEEIDLNLTNLDYEEELENAEF